MFGEESTGRLVWTLNIVIKVIIICFICLNMLVNNNDARPKIRSPNRGQNWYPGRITVPANLVSRLEIWGARDNGIPPRSTPDSIKDCAAFYGGRFTCDSIITETVNTL